MKFLKFSIILIFIILAIFFFFQSKWIEAAISLLFAFINHIWMDLDKLNNQIKELDSKLNKLGNKINDLE
jgi:cell division protein FtsB